MPLPSRAVRSGLALAVLLALLLAVGVILKRRGGGAAAPEGAGPARAAAAGASLTSDLGGLSVQPYTNSGIPVDPDGRFSILVRAAQAEHLTLHASADAGALAADVEIDARDVKEEVVIRLAKLK